MSIPILLATTNPAKRAQLQWLLEEFDLSFQSPAEFPAERAPGEPGGSHAENAALKAVHWSKVAGGLAIASDGGIAIPALGERWRALHTARASGAAPGDDLARIQHLLSLMEPYHSEERRAFFHEAVALANRGELLAVFEAESPPGYLVDRYEGGPVNPGFWLESLWWVPEHGTVLAALRPAERARLDTAWHRLRPAVQAFLGDRLARRGRRAKGEGQRGKASCTISRRDAGKDREPARSRRAGRAAQPGRPASVRHPGDAPLR